MKHLSKNLRRALAVTAIAALLVGTAAAASTVTKRTIEANYMGIKLVVDGVAVTPKDATGNTVEPFVSSGTTYLPVRAVANALGKEVTWDGSTNTVYIGQVPGAAENWMTKLPPYQVNNGQLYDGSDPKRFFTVAGEKQTAGVVLKHHPYANGYQYFKEAEHGASALWNTNLAYDSMTVTVGHVGDVNVSAALEVYLDGVYSAEYPLQWDAAPQTITIPLNRSPNVKLTLRTSGNSTYGSDTSFGFYDISFS